jgi:hypothetical protein
MLSPSIQGSAIRPTAIIHYSPLLGSHMIPDGQQLSLAFLVNLWWIGIQDRFVDINIPALPHER